MGKTTRLLLAFILLTALGLRFWGIERRGFLHSDEAYYALEGRTVPSALAYFLNPNGQSSLKEHLVQKGCILPTGTAKPSFMLLLSSWMTVFGQSDAAAMSMTALFGALSVLLAFALGARYFGNTAGLLAAFLLAVSGLHIWYSRSLLANVPGVFFLLLGLLLYLSWAGAPERPVKKRAVLVSGLVLGFAFTVHYALLPNLAVFALCEAERLRRGARRLREEFLLLLIFAAGVAAVPLAADLAYFCVYELLGAGLEGIAHFTYFEYVLRQFLWSGPAAGSSFGGGSVLYLKGFAETCGWFSVWFYGAALACSARLFFKCREFGPRVLILQGWGTLLFWTLSPGISALRAFVAFAPLAAILAGMCLAAAARGLGGAARKALLAGACAAVFFSGWKSVREMTETRSFFPKAAAWLSGRGQTEVVSMGNWPLMQFYLGRKIYANHDRVLTRSDLDRAAAGRKLEYIVTDNAEEAFFRGKKTGVYPDLAALYALPAPDASWKLGAGERFMPYDSSDYPRHLSELKIYRLARVPRAEKN